MPRQRFTAEQIIGKLREVEVLVAKGGSVADASRQIGVVEQTLYLWRKEYGEMPVDQARRMKDLEAENVRLKKLVADLSLDKMILVEASKVAFYVPPAAVFALSRCARFSARPSGGSSESSAGCARNRWPISSECAHHPDSPTAPHGMAVGV